jgi:hypothetical protein
VKPTIYLHLASGLRMRRAIPPPLATGLHGVHTDYLSLANSTKQRPSALLMKKLQAQYGTRHWNLSEPVESNSSSLPHTYTKAFQVSLHVLQMVPFPWVTTCVLHVPIYFFKTSVNTITVIHFSEFCKSGTEIV